MAQIQPEETIKLVSLNLPDMTTDDLVEWIQTLPGTAALKQKACDAIRANQIAGSDLDGLTSKDDLKDIDGLPPLFRAKLWTGITQLKANSSSSGTNSGTNSNTPAAPPAAMTAQQRQSQMTKNSQIDDKMARMNAQQEKIRKQREARAQAEAQARARAGTSTSLASQVNINTINVTHNNVSKKDDTSFTVPIVRGNKQVRTRVRFEKWNTVLDLKQAYVDQEGGDINELNLICKGKQLNDSTTLGDAGISGMKPVSATFKVRGGMAADEKEDTSFFKKQNVLRLRLPDFDNKNIEASFEADCIMGYDEEDTIRVKMPCGHVFDPLTIYKFVESQLANHHKTDISCPMDKCGKIWEYGDIVSAADLDSDEQTKLASVLESRAMLKTGKFKECPGCKGMVEKSDELYMLRVHCNSKECQNQPDFCWLCTQPWQGGGFAVCGNADCHTAIVNEELKIENCGTTKEVWSRADVDCPKLRACPRCLALVTYKDHCKHMKCWSCSENFCFICLSLGHKDPNDADSVKWDCKTGDSHSGQCELAPVQKIK